MYSPQQIFDSLLEAYNGSSRKVFQEFLNGHPNTTHWAIAADFCLSSKDHPNHCFSFTIIADIENFSQIKSEISAAVRSDIKSKRTIAEQSVEFLRDPRFFHLIVAVPNSRNLFDDGANESPLNLARECVQLTVKKMEDLERGVEAIRRARILLQESKANGFNHKLFGDMILLAVLYPFVSLMIARERAAKLIAWLPDRDSMTTYCDEFVWDMAIGSLHGLAESEKISISSTTFPITIPSPATGEMWFDEFVRLADHFAGTVAAWDFDANLVPVGPKSDKFVRMLENVMAGAENSVILKLSLTKKTLQASRIVVGLATAAISSTHNPTPNA